MGRGRSVGSYVGGHASCRTALGHFLRFRRIALGLRQHELAKLVGINHAPEYNVLETGKIRNPGQKRLESLAKALKCELSELQVLIPKRESPTELGRLIQRQREKLGMTRADLAAKSKIRPEYISNLETAQDASIGIGKVKSLADALDISQKELTKFVGLGTRKKTINAFGQLIRDGRRRVGIQQFRLAEMLGVSRQYISQMELNHKSFDVRPELIVKIARALEIDVKMLKEALPRRRLKKGLIDESTLSGFLKKQRLALGLPAYELAKMAGIKAHEVFRAERGGTIRLGSLKKLETALGCHFPEELLKKALENDSSIICLK